MVLDVGDGEYNPKVFQAPGLDATSNLRNVPSGLAVGTVNFTDPSREDTHVMAGGDPSFHTVNHGRDRIADVPDILAIIVAGQRAIQVNPTPQNPGHFRLIPISDMNSSRASSSASNV